MKILKWFLTAVLSLAAVLVLVGIFLPDRSHVERSISIDAPAGAVYPYLIDFEQFNRWSPWYRRDPGVRISFEGGSSGVGAKMIWQSDHPQVGSGSQTIVEAQPDKLVRTNLDFGDQGAASAFFSIDESAGGSQVTWGFDTDWGFNLIGRYMGLMMDKWVGADYESGLANLKELVESQ